MTICTPSNTFRDFLFCLSNTFRITDVQHFLAFNMVEMQGCMMGFISTISTTMFDFITPKPLANCFCSIIGLFINSFLISWFCKSSFPHILSLCRIIKSVTRFAISLLNFTRISLAPPLACFSLPLFLKFRFHNLIIALTDSAVNGYPCKPDIKKATYDEVKP